MASGEGIPVGTHAPRASHVPAFKMLDLCVSSELSLSIYSSHVRVVHRWLQPHSQFDMSAGI